MRRALDVVQRLVEGEAYHGTASSFRAFRPVKRDFHPSQVGIWFTSSSQSAAHIAGLSKRMVDDQPRVISVKLRMEHPMRFETYADFLQAFRDYGNDAGKLRQRLLRAGYDGIEITQSDTDGAGLRTDWAVFRPQQIDILSSVNLGSD